MINGLDLFSGIGGISIALSPWVRTVAYCEQDRYAQGVILSRMADGGLERAPIWDDVTTLHGSMLPRVDIIFGGFPCQDISVAGSGAGLEGKRSGLFFEIIRLVKECNPSFVFLENVPAIRTRGLSEVINAFAEVGYDCRWTCISASSIGAPHRRERWFLMAHTKSKRTQGLRSRGKQITSAHDEQKLPLRSSESVANAECKRLEIGAWRTKATVYGAKFNGRENVPEWSVEPAVGRVVDGLPHRAHRIKCLGNSVVPAQVRKAFLMLMGMELL